jgi:hypothetical protein
MGGPSYCPDCGAARIGEKRFCAGCGTDFDAVTTTPGALRSSGPEDVGWVCEIKMETDQPLFGGTKYQFWAYAVGPEGVVNAAETDKFKPKSYLHANISGDPIAQQKLQEIVNWLVSDGWQPTGLSQGGSWYSWTFRRTSTTPLKGYE